VSHKLFLLLETLILRLLEVKSFVWQQDQALKDTFIIIHFAFQSKSGFKISDLNGP
jgi:hypothetical protein